MHRSIFVQYLLATVATVASGSAMATCDWAGARAQIDATMALRVAQITVGRDLPVGSEVYRQEFNPSANASIRCLPGPYEITIKRSLTASAMPVTGYQSPAGGTVYATNVSGIGVQFLDADNRAFPFSASSPGCDGAEACVMQVHNQLKFVVSFIKTGAQVEAGAISSVNLPGVDISYEFQGQQLPVRRVRFSGQLRIVAQTCQTPHVRVNMGQHKVSAFESDGATHWQDFDIVLNQCPAFYGYYSGGAMGAGIFNRNKIAFQIDPTQRAFSGEQGILSLTPEARGAMKTAEGIGLQLALENTQPIQFSTLIDSGIQTQAQEGGSYFIRLKARYISQPGAVVKSGPANATATFTLNYQ